MSYKFYLERIKEKIPEEEFLEITSDLSSLDDFGFEYLDYDEPDVAYNIFMASIDHNGVSSFALNGLAVTLFELGKFHIAEKIIFYALEKYPNDPMSLANVGSIYWQKEDYPMAIYYYNKSLEKDAFMLESYFNLVYLYSETGDLLLAYMTAMKAMKIFPDDIEVKKMLDEILIDMAIAFY